jgi:acyl dehydratase
MTSNIERARAALEARIGHETVSDWHTVEQKQINAFADATLDHQFIHIDPVAAAARSPYKVTIAHGFLTLSMTPYLVASALANEPPLEGVAASVNYGLDRVRFPSPVKVDARIRARCELMSVEQVTPNALQLKRKVTIDIEGEAKPGCIAETLARVVFA